jgi:F-box and leucine-rich repeat protein 7
VIALSLTKLRKLNLAFCGSAVGDNSIRTISLHLTDLWEISVRGCVRVTKAGVETLCVLARSSTMGIGIGTSVCEELRVVDLSQCRNFTGGSKRWWNTVSRSGKIKFIL